MVCEHYAVPSRFPGVSCEDVIPRGNVSSPPSVSQKYLGKFRVYGHGFVRSLSFGLIHLSTDYTSLNKYAQILPVDITPSKVL